MTDSANTPAPHHLVQVLPAEGAPIDAVTAVIWLGGEDGHEDDFIVYLMDTIGADPFETAYFESLAEAGAYAVEHAATDRVPGLA